MAQPNDLEGLRAIVTAGASGIGAAITDALTDAGARCLVCSTTDETIETFQADRPDVHAMVADVSDTAAVDALFEAAAEHLGGLDVLINNAGISGPTQPLEDIDEEDWRRTLSVNLDGTFLCTRRAIPLLRESGGGSIVNISSIAGRVGYPKRSPYAASKWAMVGLTKTLAMELGPDDIRVNVLLPGMVNGPRLDNVISARAESAGVSTDKVREQATKHISLGRPVEAEDVARAVVFLAGPGGRNISGQAIPIDGDMQTVA